jgi:two-component system response regulator PilR (NtrC family)
MKQPLALVIDDEPDICELLTLTLGRMDIRTETAMDVAGAKALLGEHHFDICLTDMRLPDGDGLQLVEWMQSHAPGVPVAVITAHGNVETAVQALKLGAFDFISKPLDLGNLRTIVENALKVRRPDDDGESKLRGNSVPMRELRDMIDRVAQSQAPVHIAGESGTGKELVARLIHDSGPRADGPFVPVNCGAIPAELVESEFFGHRKGAFTGAVGDKDGLIQSARDGTLFLDEIADLPLAMQVKLLRVIQEKKVRPVGAAREESADIRILSATHRNLSKMVAAGEFREDLYYRINVIELRVPALRDRGDDVLLLADHILERLGASVSLDDSARKALLHYDFPGNVRELENMLERAVTLCTGKTISADDLHMREAATRATPTVASALGDQLEDVQRQAIVEALEKTRYNKTAAAKLLGLSFRQLRYRIKKLGIE